VTRIVRAADQPRHRSTRDSRDRVDLVTEVTMPGVTQLKADLITYHPGDTAARHYHDDADHFFYVLSGSGTLHTDAAHRVQVGDLIRVEAGEVHHFHNDTGADLLFFELWVPAPRDTIWVDADDV